MAGPEHGPENAPPGVVPGLQNVDEALKQLGVDPKGFWEGIPGGRRSYTEETLQRAWEGVDKTLRQNGMDPGKFWDDVHNGRPITPATPAPSPSPTPAPPEPPGWLQPGGRDPMNPLVPPGGGHDAGQGHGYVEPGQMPLSGDAPGMEPLDLGMSQGPVLASAPTGGEPWFGASDGGDWNAGAAMPTDPSGHLASGPLAHGVPAEDDIPEVPPVEGIELASGDVHAPVDAIDDAMGATEQLADAPSHDGGYATGDGSMPSDSDYA
jgi:hypothetical protein